MDSLFSVLAKRNALPQHIFFRPAESEETACFGVIKHVHFSMLFIKYITFVEMRLSIKNIYYIKYKNIKKYIYIKNI